MAQALPLCMPGKCSTSELHPQPNQIISQNNVKTPTKTIQWTPAIEISERAPSSAKFKNFNWKNWKKYTAMCTCKVSVYN